MVVEGIRLVQLEVIQVLEQQMMPTVMVVKWDQLVDLLGIKGVEQPCFNDGMVYLGLEELYHQS